jgi:hypothetical protein
LLKEAAIWYFGESAGLDFNSNSVTLTDGKLTTNEGCATISDKDGNYFFILMAHLFTKNHKMANGYGLLGKIQYTIGYHSATATETHMFIIFSP